MKLIIAGASGFVATEVIRQCLSIPKITSVIAVARRPISAPVDLVQSADASKLHSVVLDDYDSYPDGVRQEFANADACIWTVAITPSKSRGLEFDEVRRVCHDYTLAGLQAIFEAHGKSGSNAAPLRFMYMSGSAAQRDPKEVPRFMSKYLLMRGETENQVLGFAMEHNGAVEACVSKPGLITAPGQLLKTIIATVLKPFVPSVGVKEISAAMLHQVLNGFEKETLQNDDLVRIGRQALSDVRE
ncbi:hypothetical protein N7G274_007606 [Stereocaulon virgatum]|uniref:NAD(P)-binding domain-containing protein n=1 Tax=Stereocaulon virgatum TaxID=373712 RepID=A0ABR4A1C2_9LECA